MSRAPGPVRAWAGVVIVVAAVLAIAVIFFIAPLNPNLRYEAGVKEVTGSAAGGFSHRPLAYRLITNVIFRAADTLSSGVVSFELVVRILLAVLIAGAVVLLWKGLTAHGVTHPGRYAIVGAGVLVLFGDVSAGEPEWLAALLTIAGCGVALLGRRRPWLFTGSAGLLFVAASGMKIITLTTAVLGLLAVALLDRRQAVRALIASVIIGLSYVGATLVWVPWEVTWLLDIQTVQNSTVDGLPDALPYFAELVARRPVLTLIPAAMILAGARERVVIAGSIALTIMTILLQGQYFEYHGTVLVMIAAISALRAVSGRVTVAVGVAVLVVAVATSGLTMINSDWIYDHQRWWGGALLIVTAAGIGWAIRSRGRRPTDHPIGGTLAVLAVLALTFPGSTPWGAHLLRPENPDGSRPPTTFEARAQGESTARSADRVIGGDGVEVTYLTSGEWPYFIGHPTRCRFPSPLFLQRTLKPARLATASYAENVACLSAPGSRWLIIESHWFVINKQPDEVKAILEREWDCTAATEVGELRLCPRRSRPS